MSASLASAANAEPNLTPILDLVFQLITFFMLVMNFKAGELDQKLLLPVVGSARPVDMKNYDLLVLNVRRDGTLNGRGITQDPESFIRAEAEATRLKNHLDAGAVSSGKVDLPSTVVLRADRGVRFATLNKVLESCRKHGYRQFAMRATDHTLEQ